MDAASESKKDQALAAKAKAARERLEKLELERARRANPAWPHWRRARLSLDRIIEIIQTEFGEGETVEKARALVASIEHVVDGLNPGAPPEKAV